MSLNSCRMTNHVFVVTCTRVSIRWVVYMNCEACESLHWSTKMCRTSEYVQLRLLSCHKSNIKFAKAVWELFSVEGIRIERKTVAKYYKWFKWDLPLRDLPHSGRLPTLERDTSISSIRSWNKTMSQYWCLCLQFVNKVKMERIIVYMKNRESAFWKKGVFCDGQ